jgi:hypothetical protein
MEGLGNEIRSVFFIAFQLFSIEQVFGFLFLLLFIENFAPKFNILFISLWVFSFYNFNERRRKLINFEILVENAEVY